MRKVLLSLALVLMLFVAGFAIAGPGNFGYFNLPKDGSGIVPENLSLVGAQFATTSSTDTVSVATGPTLIYGCWVASDGTGTDWGKITTATATGSITVANTAAYPQSTTSKELIFYDAPILITSPYIVVNDTHTIFGVYYK